ncbi:MAG: hypothetical protein FWG78_01995 [Coriobacteriia bacterium]|nr:hypothetical protein [Coriobacteriia bacterium]
MNFTLLDADVADYLTALFEQESYVRFYKNLFWRKQIPLTLIGVIICVAIVLGLGQRRVLFSFETIATFVVLIFASPFVIANAITRYQLFMNPNPTLAVSSRSYPRAIGTVKLVIDSYGISIDKKYERSTKNIPWKEIKAVYRLADAWYFLVNPPWHSRFLSWRVIIIPLTALDMPRQDNELENLCYANWLGEVEIQSSLEGG